MVVSTWIIISNISWAGCWATDSRTCSQQKGILLLITSFLSSGVQTSITQRSISQLLGWGMNGYPHNGLSIVLHTFKQVRFTFVFNVSLENNNKKKDQSKQSISPPRVIRFDQPRKVRGSHKLCWPDSFLSLLKKDFFLFIQILFWLLSSLFWYIL